MTSFMEYLATALFAIAIVHTFSVPVFARLANRGGAHAGLWHLLSEVEAVFGVWACVLLACMALVSGVGDAVAYIDTRNFTEPAFVFVIMVVAASRPIIELVNMAVRLIARVLPLRNELAMFFVIMSFVPLAGSFITEPAAMTLAALLLRDTYFGRHGQDGFKYMTLGVLFVNISIGGVLTAYAAPPVLMVAQTFNWDTAYMSTHFGWRAAVAVCINAGVLTFLCRTHLLDGSIGGHPDADDAPVRPAVPWVVIAIHTVFLVGVVVSAHHPIIFLGFLMLFIGYAHAYKRHQNPLLIREGLMVGFFLAGLVVLGGLQKWWLQDLLAGLSPTVLYWGATALTAVTDNAALTYLGSLVEGTSEQWRYMLVAGAVTGGGLTVIANAPNPAGFSILKGSFPDGAISPLKLLLSAVVPTLVAAFMFLLPKSF
ncbi:putative Na+/H+ antiporter [Pusillimonas sp. MFBS29]|uniref:putative Na+/H+ antiporter n=1 Tax=Pusillimonas sp. MFBS29 TaxID=2886690 RepID=UPI001D12A354|nr:putative Na+/H+ antiporter [Pusillimonas sp. MFBS29]MCC2595952.1 putative Na+/H+ antiporter [Pusillimonas sp. MFBS29]